MEIKTAIEIQGWGDFDVRYTKFIMVSSENVNTDEMIKEYCALRGLPGTSGLPSNMLEDTTDDFVDYLRKRGFKKLKTKEICFGD